MPGIGDFFKSGSIGEQLLVWNLLGSVITTLITPALNELAYEENKLATNVILSPAELADMVTQKIYEQNSAAGEAEQSGINTGRFDAMVRSREGRPELGILIAGLQRLKLPIGSGAPGEVSVTGALQHMGIPEEWWPVILSTSINIPSGAEVMNAWLEGQISEQEAHTRWLAAGNDDTWFQTAYNANGQAPTPMEALELWNRGIIPESGTGPEATSYEQAFLEGPWRNKWLPAFKALRWYVLPPRSVTAAYREGILPRDRAEQFLRDAGVHEADFPLFLQAKVAATTHTDKTLTRTDVVTAYEAKLITQATALTDLGAIGYHGDVALTILKLADLKVERTSQNAAVNRIRTLYTGRKINRGAAAAALTKVMPAGTDTVTLLKYWDIIAAQNVRQLTPAQITEAYVYKLMTQAEADAELQALGYTPYDAWLLLSLKEGKSLPGKPAQGPAPIGLLP